MLSWLYRVIRSNREKPQRRQQAERLGEQGLQLLEKERNIPAALSLFRRAVRLNPREVRWHWGMGQCYLMQMRGYVRYLELCRNDLPWIKDRYKRAMDCFNMALRRDRRCSEAHYGQGQLLALRGLLEEACRSWEQALSVDPAHEGARRSLAEAIDRMQAGPARPLF